MYNPDVVLETYFYRYRSCRYDKPKTVLKGYFSTGLLRDNSINHQEIRLSNEKVNTEMFREANWFTSFYRFLDDHKRLLRNRVSNDIKKVPFVLNIDKCKKLAILPLIDWKMYITATLSQGVIYLTTYKNLNEDKNNNEEDEHKENDEKPPEEDFKIYQSKKRAGNKPAGGKPKNVPTKPVPRINYLINQTGHLYGVFEMTIQDHVVIYPQKINGFIKPNAKDFSTPLISDYNQALTLINQYDSLTVKKLSLPEQLPLKTMDGCIHAMLTNSKTVHVEFTATGTEQFMKLNELENVSVCWDPSISCNFLRSFFGYIKYNFLLEMEKLDQSSSKVMEANDLTITFEKGEGSGSPIKRIYYENVQKAVPDFFIQGF